MQLNLKTKNSKYPIIIKPNSLKKLDLPDNSYIITDKNIKKYYGKFFKNYNIITIQPGEKNKKLQTIENIAERLLKMGADRDSTLVALGGGVIGDMAGFLAAIYMRGINFIQIPTTLLAMVDSSVGGKTGVDISAGKNLLGVFHQPQAVYIDPQVLKTLPVSEFSNGMAEAIKHGVIDGKLFKWTYKHRHEIKKQDKKIITKLIYKNCEVKKEIVEKDEREKNIRALLNLGHTFGHAIETISKYKIAHGQAVSIGLVQAARLADLKQLDKLTELLEFFKLKTELPKGYTSARIIAAMQADKKIKNKKLTLIIPKKLGHVKIIKNYPSKKITQCLSQSK